MNKIAQKGWKPFVLKVVIIAMSICYVFGPSHNEVNKLLHVLTHQLEMTDHVIAQSTTIHSNNEVHEAHALNTSEDGHEHKILKVLERILRATDSNQNQERSNILKLKIDKHLRSKADYKQNFFTLSIPIKHLFLFTEQKILKGYKQNATEPPQFL